MRFLLSLILLYVPGVLFGQKNCGTKGFERLITFSNATKISMDEFTETNMIVDSLYKLGCKAYDMNKDGVVQTASLTALFGKICSTYNTNDAVVSYLRYMDIANNAADDEISQQLDNLFIKQPELVLTEIKKQKNASELCYSLAWGMLNNLEKQSNAPTLANYESLFYQRNPIIKDLEPNFKNEIASILQSLKNELE